MQELLDYKNINELQKDFQKKIQANILKNFKLESDFKTALIDIDFGKYTFSPDLFALYYSATKKHETHLITRENTLFTDINQEISVAYINPLTSAADYFFANDESGPRSSHGLSLPNLEPEETQIFSMQLKKYFSLLSQIEASCASSHLCNSIAIYARNALSANSGSSVATQGRIYVKHLPQEYPCLYLLDILIHEIAHLYFNVINSLYPFISDFNARTFSVGTGTDRPIYGVFHAVFVLYRLIYVYQLAEKILNPNPSQAYEKSNYADYLYTKFQDIPIDFKFRLHVYLMKFDEGVNQLLANDAISTLGKELLTTMKKEIAL